jgi:transcriptional regulator with XRE-family HTH domain
VPDFAKRLKIIREAKQMSQAELADKSGLHPAHISHFECGKRKPCFENIINLANALNCSADDFYEKTT